MIVQKCDSCGRELSGKHDDPAVAMRWWGRVPNPSKPRLSEHPKKPGVMRANLLNFRHVFEFCLDCSKRVNETIGEALLMELTARTGVTLVEPPHIEALLKGELEGIGHGEEADLDEDEIPF